MDIEQKLRRYRGTHCPEINENYLHVMNKKSSCSKVLTEKKLLKTHKLKYLTHRERCMSLAQT